MGEYTSNYSLYLPTVGETGWGSLVNQNFILIDQLLPIGSIISFAGSMSPDGWLLCNGQAISRTEYSKLYSVLGTTYGSGNGSTTFNLPDLKDRVVIGVSDSHLLGETGGEETHTLTVEEMPSHRHAIILSSGSSSFDYPERGTVMGNRRSNTENTGGNKPHNNMQPYFVLNYIIKY